MSVTPEVEQEILADYNRNPRRFSPFRVAKAAGVPIQDVMSVVERSQDRFARRTIRYDGFGSPSLKPYIVGRRQAMSSGWDNEDEKIADARGKFEAGTHILVTGRDGPWLLLYCIPRRRGPDPKPNYFSTEVHA